jgi:hypothetical protein
MAMAKSDQMPRRGPRFRVGAWDHPHRVGCARSGGAALIQRVPGLGFRRPGIALTSHYLFQEGVDLSFESSSDTEHVFDYAYPTVDVGRGGNARICLCRPPDSTSDTLALRSTEL